MVQKDGRAPTSSELANVMLGGPHPWTIISPVKSLSSQVEVRWGTNTLPWTHPVEELATITQGGECEGVFLHPYRSSSWSVGGPHEPPRARSLRRSLRGVNVGHLWSRLVSSPSGGLEGTSSIHSRGTRGWDGGWCPRSLQGWASIHSQLLSTEVRGGLGGSPSDIYALHSLTLLRRSTRRYITLHSLTILHSFNV